MKDYQSILFPYAYNILGSSEDARDAVQEVLVKYLSIPKEGIENEKNYLIRSVINQSINVKKTKQKIVSGDVWLPEPIATEEADKDMHLSDIVTYSMMVLMEQLNPKERAVFILKEGFGYSHEEIAGLLSETVENSRKLLSRAKTKLDTPRPVRPLRPTPFPTDLLDKFVSAIRGGDVHALETLLTDDIRYTADGGSKIKVLAKLTIGQKDVAGLLMVVHQRFHQEASIVPAMVNHQPAFLYYQNGQLFQCQVFSLSEDGSRIAEIDNVIDPEKLKVITAHRPSL